MLSTFQTYFLLEGDIYALTTYTNGNNLKRIFRRIDFFFVLENPNLYSSCHECDIMLKIIKD